MEKRENKVSGMSRRYSGRVGGVAVNPPAASDVALATVIDTLGVRGMDARVV